MLAPGRFISPAEQWQRQVKAELLLQSMATMGIDAMTVGDAELAFGKDFLLAQVQKYKIPMIAANLVDATTQAPLFPPGMVKELGSVKMGIIGLTSEALKIDGVTALPAIPAAKQAVETLKAQGATQFMALSYQSFGVNEKLAREVPELSVIVQGGTRQQLSAPRLEGNAALLEAGGRGKTMGAFEAALKPGGIGWDRAAVLVGSAQRREELSDRIEVFRKRLKDAKIPKEQERLQKQIDFYQGEIDKLAEKPEEKPTAPRNDLRNTLTALGAEIADDPTVGEMVRKALERMNNPEEQPQQPDSVVNPPPPTVSGDFVGSEACAGCHQAQYRQWQTTAHAHAYATLEKANRNNDFQCFGCHVTGNFMPGGPKSPDAVGILKNVGCESCHLAGKNHLTNPGANSLPSATPERVCLDCHTKDQTGDRFVYADYLKQISHNFKGPFASPETDRLPTATVPSSMGASTSTSSSPAPAAGPVSAPSKGAAPAAGH